MAQAGEKFFVDTHPTKDVVVSSLTRDISVDACIFDLIDNSVDAARNATYAKLVEGKIQDKLPESYSGFKISITLNGECFLIEDNCGGIGVEKLKKMVLRFGERSSHKMGIGLFGVGLNRALFKLGKISHLKTDTGKERAELILDTEKYLQDSQNWDLPAQAFSSRGVVGTAVEIKQLPEDIARRFADQNQNEQLKKDIGKRYGRYIKKGLEIFVNEKPVIADNIEIREDGPYEAQYKSYKTPEGVYIHIACGQHAKHRFPAEPDHNKKINDDLTADFGWSILCNDRAILIAGKDWKTGWDTAKLHSENYGFVGYVEFVSENPALLPWNTTKTDVDLNNKAYQSALEEMRVFAENWRSNSRDAKKKKQKNIVLKSRPKNPEAGSSLGDTLIVPVSSDARAAKYVTQPTAIIKPAVKQDQTQFFTVLPTDIDEKHCYDKHLTLVHEAKTLDISKFGYSGLALIRMLFETTAHTYFERHKKYDDLKKSAIATRNKGRAKILTTDEEKQLTPSLEEIFAFIEANPDVWGTAKANHLKHSMTKMAAHKKILNGVLHNPFQVVSNGVAIQIRDEVLPLLRHLIQT